MSNVLDAVFDSYDQRKRLESEVARTGAAKAQAEIEEALGAIKAQVLPALQALERVITERGHKAKITEKLGDRYPAVILEFTAFQRTPGPPFHVASRVIFSGFAGSVEAKSEIALAAARPPVKIPLAELSAEWVAAQVSETIAAALERA